MDEDFKDVTENSKKTWIIFILIILIIIVIGYFFVFQKFYFSVKNIKLELGETLTDDVLYYLNKKVPNSSGYKLDISKVKQDEVGEYTYSVKYNNRIKKGKVIVEDTKAPEFTLQPLSVEEGSEDIYLGDFLETCTDYSKPCLVTFKNEKDDEKLSKIGTYTVDIVVSDLYGNKKNAKATLNVVQKGTLVDEKTKDLEYSSNSKGTNEFKGQIYEKLENALKPDSHEYNETISSLSTIDLEKYVQDNFTGYKLISSEIIELYNKSGYIISYSIELKISNGKEKVVYVDKNKVTIPDETTKEQDENTIEP